MENQARGGVQCGIGTGLTHRAGDAARFSRMDITRLWPLPESGAQTQDKAAHPVRGVNTLRSAKSNTSYQRSYMVKREQNGAVNFLSGEPRKALGFSKSRE